MFNILSVNPTGLFSYGIHKTIYLDKQGSVLLEGVNLDRNGDSNGSGKTSFLNAIVHIAYGKNPSGEGADKVVNEFLGKYFGELVFLDKNNRKWRITDVRKWRKADKYPDEKFDGYVEEPSEIHNSGLRRSGTDVYLEAWDESNGLWIDERSSNRGVGDARLDLKATRKKIVDILEIDYEQFMSVVYLAQQQTLQFISGTHKERLAVLAQLSDLKAWDDRILKIRADISEEESERDRLEAQLSGLGHISLSKPNLQDKQLIQSSIDNFDLQMADCDSQISDISTRSKTWKQNISDINLALTKMIGDLRDAEREKISAQTAVDLTAKIFSEDCQNIRLLKRPYEIAKIETDISELNGQIMARRFDLEQLLTGSGRCPRCRTNVTIDHILRHRELLALDIKVLDEKVIGNKNTLEKSITDWEADVNMQLDARVQKYKSDSTILVQDLNACAAKLDALSLKFDKLKAQETLIGRDPTSELYGIEQRRLAILSHKSMKEMQLKAWDDQLKKYSEYENLISAAHAKILEAQFNIRHLRALEKLFGDKGIKAFKLDNILNILNQSLDKYIDIISDGSVKVWVTQYREKTDGDLAADLQIVVREGHKHEVPFALYSGGERQQITLAFIGAFWHLASRCGAGVNIMCLDEIFGPLDEYNTSNVFNYLDHMRLNGKSTIFIVTHNENIKHQVKFDQIWTITKQNHMSTLDTTH